MKHTFGRQVLGKKVFHGRNIKNTDRARRAGRDRIQDPESQAPCAAVWFISYR